MNNFPYNENEDSEWGWFIPLDLQYINKKEQIIYPLKHSLNYHLKYYKNNLKTIDENSEIYEDIYSTIDVAPIPTYKSHIDEDLINNINNINNNKNQPVFNILNCILIIKCNNIKYILFRCMHYTSTYFEYIYKYMSSLLYPKIK